MHGASGGNIQDSSIYTLLIVLRAHCGQLTCLTVDTSEPSGTDADVFIDQILTPSSILTWLTRTLINI